LTPHPCLPRAPLSCFCFDFSGSGLSEGDLVTLGARESGDLEAVVSFLRIQGRTSHIALWGRSMGAVTAVLYARTNLSIAGVVLDSPFARLTDLIRDIVVRDIVAEAPTVLVSAAILALRTSIRRRIGVDIAHIDALAAAGECYQPALFVHAQEDELIYPGHSQALSAAWAGDSRTLLVGEGQGHNTLRPRHIVSSCVTFLVHVLDGGLKDAEALFRDVGDGKPPPPPPPSAADPTTARAAVLQRLWMQAAEEQAGQDRAGPSGEAGVQSDGEEEEEEEQGEDEEDEEDGDWDQMGEQLAGQMARLQQGLGLGGPPPPGDAH
jgi:dienelactone hydrolase